MTGDGGPAGEPGGKGLLAPHGWVAGWVERAAEGEGEGAGKGEQANRKNGAKRRLEKHANGRQGWKKTGNNG